MKHYAPPTLAPLRLPAAALGVTEPEREALIWFRDEVAAGRVPWHADHPEDVVLHPFDTHPLRVFAMSHYHCGTVGCIGGWASAAPSLTGVKYPFGFGTRSDAATRCLFYPYNVDYRATRPQLAALAVDHWLAGAANQAWPRAQAGAPVPTELRA